MTVYISRRSIAWNYSVLCIYDSLCFRYNWHQGRHIDKHNNIVGNIPGYGAETFAKWLVDLSLLWHFWDLVFGECCSSLACSRERLEWCKNLSARTPDKQVSFSLLVSPMDVCKELNDKFSSCWSVLDTSSRELVFLLPVAPLKGCRQEVLNHLWAWQGPDYSFYERDLPWLAGRWLGHVLPFLRLRCMFFFLKKFLLKNSNFCPTTCGIKLVTFRLRFEDNFTHCYIFQSSTRGYRGESNPSWTVRSKQFRYKHTRIHEYYMNIIDTAIICDGRCEFEFIGQLSPQQLQIYGARREDNHKDMGLM